MKSTTDFLLGLPDSSVRALTELLALPPTHGVSRPSSRWLVTQEKVIVRLPKDVLRPTKLTERLALKVSETFDAPGIAPPAVLCSTHRQLHPWLMRQIFNLVVTEITLRSDRVRCYHEDDALGCAVKEATRKMDDLHAIWVEEGTWRMMFPERTPPKEYKMMKSHCEACILATIGARSAVLIMLRANLIARKRDVEPRLWRIVQGWVDWFDPEEASMIVRESRKLGKTMRTCRKELAKRRRERRERRKSRKMQAEAEGVRPFSSASASSGRTVMGGCCTKLCEDGGSLDDAARAEEEMWRAYEEEIYGCKDGEEMNNEAEISDWYARSQVDLSDSGRVHPAFRKMGATSTVSYSAKSAVPNPLTTHGNKISDVHKGDDNTDASSWVSCSAHTISSGYEPKLKDAPPVPSIPSRYADLPAVWPSSSSKSPYTTNTESFKDRIHGKRPPSNLTINLTPTTNPTPPTGPTPTSHPRIDPVTGRALTGQFVNAPGGPVPTYASSSVYPEDPGKYAPAATPTRTPMQRDYACDDSYLYGEANDDGDGMEAPMGVFRDPFAEGRPRLRRFQNMTSRYSPRNSFHDRGY